MLCTGKFFAHQKTLLGVKKSTSKVLKIFGFTFVLCVLFDSLSAVSGGTKPQQSKIEFVQKN